MNIEEQPSDPDGLRPTHVQATASFGDRNSPTLHENNANTSRAKANWIRARNTDRRNKRTKGSSIDVGSIGQSFSTNQHQNLEAQSSSESPTNTNTQSEHYKHPNSDKSSGILEVTVEPPVLTPNVSIDLMRIPDAQGTARTMFHSDNLGYQDLSAEKAFPEQSTRNLSCRLSSENISTNSCPPKRVQKRTSRNGNSSTRPPVSVQSGSFNPRKRHSTLHPKTHNVDKMTKGVTFPEKGNVIPNEQSRSRELSLLPQNDTPTLHMTLQSSQMSSNSNSLDSAMRVKNHVTITAIKGCACDECGNRFKDKRQLNRHQGFHCETKSHQCEVCSKLFTSDWKLGRHMRVHSGEKPFECEVCKRTFSQKGNLAKHVRIHSGEKPFTCEMCNRGFLRLADLRMHRRTHTEEKPYVCEICMNRFSRASRLQKHSRVHTGEKPYECEVCKKTFSQKDKLTRHKRVHSGEKPFNCETCNRSFSDCSGLRVHRRIHTEEKPYMCKVCMRMFSDLSNFRRHNLIHQNGKKLKTKSARK